MTSIISERLTIRPFAETDVQDFYNYRSEKELAKFQSYNTFTLQQATDFIKAMQGKELGKRGEWIQLAIELNAENKVIGDIGLKPELYDELIVEFGITVSPQYQKQGFAIEALKAIFNKLFSNYSVHRIIGITDVENSSSIKLLKATGMRQEASYKQSFNNKSTWRDEFLFAILRSEWNKKII